MISRAAAAGPSGTFLAVSDDALVSVDFEGDSHSAIVDAPSTLVSGQKHAEVLAWYDNESGYSYRLVDLAAFVGERFGPTELAGRLPERAIRVRRTGLTACRHP